MSWDAIEETAAKLGVKAEAIRKWRVRGVSHKWRLALVRADVRRQIDEADFDKPPGPKHPRQQTESTSEAA